MENAVKWTCGQAENDQTRAVEEVADEGDKIFGSIKQILHFASEQRIMIGLAVVAGLLYAAVNACFFYYLRPSLAGLVNTDAGGFRFAMFLLGFYTTKSILHFGSEYLAISAIQDMVVSVREKFLRNYLCSRRSHSISGEDLSKFLEDINQMCGAVKLLTATLVKDSLTLVGLVIVLLMLAPKLAMAVVLIYIVAAAPAAWLGRKMKAQAGLSRQANEQLVGKTAEFFKFQAAIQSLHATKFIIEKLRPPLEREALQLKRLSQIDRGTPGVIELTAVTGFIALLLFAGPGIFLDLTVSAAVTFSVASVALYLPLKNLGALHVGLQRASASAERIGHFLIENTRRTAIRSFRENLSILIHECLGSSSTPILRDVRLELGKAQTVAVVGPNGAGKTTLLSCIAGLRDFNGCLSIDGAPTEISRDLGAPSWIAFAEHTPALFNISLRENITLGASVPDALVWSLLEELGLDQLRARHLSLDVLPGETGKTLSHGMQQRLILARLILHRPALVLLDEVFSPIEQSEATVLLHRLREMLPDCTIVFTTQEQNLLQCSDRVVLLQHGRLVLDGSHRELLLTDLTYRQFWQWENNDSRPYPAPTGALL